MVTESSRNVEMCRKTMSNIYIIYTDSMYQFDQAASPTKQYYRKELEVLRYYCV